MRFFRSIKSFFDQLANRSLLSVIAIVTCMIFVVEHAYESNKWGKDEIVTDDAIMYYGYLPAVFIFQDISLDFVFEGNDPRKEGIKIWASTDENGEHFLKMPVGESVMLSPFFLVSHAVAKARGELANGYSPTYYYGIAFAAWTYLFFGLLLIRRTLRKLGFRDVLIAATIFILGLATNLFHYAVLEPGISHIYSFFLFAVVLYLTVSISQKVAFWKMVVLGAALGLIMITRPTNILIAMVPVLYGVYSWKTFKARFGLIKVYWKEIFVAGVAFAAVTFIQLLVWKLGNGNWIVYSYKHEKLFFDDPQIFKFLFSYRKGAFVYYPILLLAFIGMFISLRKYKQLQVPIILFMILNIYVISSWWCWWYGGSLGARPLVESYPFLALTFAIFLERIWSKFTFVPIVAVIVFATRLNFFYEERFIYTFLHFDSMTKEAYWELMSGKQLTSDYWKLLKPPCVASRLLGGSEEEPIVREHFSVKDVVYDTVEFPRPMMEMQAKDFFIYTTYSELLIDVNLSMDSALVNNENLALVFSWHNYDWDVSYAYQTVDITKDQLEANEWKAFSMKCPVHPNGDLNSVLKVYLWNRSGKKVNVKSFKAVQVVY